MKKVLSVLLAALMLFSCFTVMAYAEEPETVTITFKYLVPNENGTGTDEEVRVIKTNKVVEHDNGAIISAGMMDNNLSDMPREFSYTYDADDFPTRKESRTYSFVNFVCESDPSFKLDFSGTKKPITKDLVFVADYDIDDTGEYTTFWEFVQSIFARINVIFEYFSEIFGF